MYYYSIQKTNLTQRNILISGNLPFTFFFFLKKKTFNFRIILDYRKVAKKLQRVAMYPSANFPSINILYSHETVIKTEGLPLVQYWCNAVS